MWRDAVVCSLLALATLMTACAQVTYTERKIVNVTVPRWIENATEDQVILDCEYEYSPNEENFVVKWYLNDNRQAVYQWIPAVNSRIFSTEFLDYVDWEYQLDSGDKFTRYRQIVLKKPTIKFRGMYQCSVSSNLGHGVAESKMDVYARAKNITLTYNTLPDSLVNVTCIVKQIYPKPDVQLFAVSSDSDVPVAIEPIGEETVSSTKGGFIEEGYDVTVSTVVQMYLLNSSADTTFRCVVLIHESDYQEVVEKVYHPTSEMAILEQLYEKSNQPSSASHISASFVCIIFVLLVL